MMFLDFLSVIVIMIGVVILSISILHTYKLIKIIPSSKYLKNWNQLLYLMFLFVLGYIGVAVGILLIDELYSMKLLTAIIFLLGAAFVLLSVTSGRRTIEDLLNTTVSKNYVENIIKSMADTLIVINADKSSTINTVNHAAVNMLGFTQEELVGKSIFDILVVSSNELEGLDHTNSLTDIETEYISKSGDKIPVNLSVSALAGNVEEEKRLIYVVQDIRVRKENERKIKKYIEKLAESEENLKRLNIHIFQTNL